MSKKIKHLQVFILAIFTFVIGYFFDQVPTVYNTVISYMTTEHSNTDSQEISKKIDQIKMQHDKFQHKLQKYNYLLNHFAQSNEISSDKEVLIAKVKTRKSDLQRKIDFLRTMIDSYKKTQRQIAHNKEAKEEAHIEAQMVQWQIDEYEQEKKKIDQKIATLKAKLEKKDSAKTNDERIDLLLESVE